MIASKRQRSQQPVLTKPTTRCAIYTRKSTEEGLEQEFNSLDAQRETDGVKVGMTALEARWRLGRPHHIFASTPDVTGWGFDYADSEDRPFEYFNVVLHGNRVARVEQMSYLSGS